MMSFYIKLLNGKPIDHPIAEDNMKTAYPNVDLDNLPESWARFIRVEPPSLGPYDAAECVYEREGDVIKDVWYIHEMSAEEKHQKQERVKKAWKEDNGPANWIFNEETCTHIPPVPLPDDGKEYEWVQEANKWVEIENKKVDLGLPEYPQDGKLYNFNASTKSWEPAE